MGVYITGIGTVNPIGDNVSESLNSLIHEKCGLRWSEEDDLMLGSVDLTNAELHSQFEIKETECSRTTLLGIKAASEAWGNNKHDDLVKTGLISSTSVGELDVSENKIKLGQSEGLTEEAGKTSEQIADYLGITGYVNTLSTACSSGANAILLGARLIQSGRLDRVVVGGVDPFCQHNKKGFSALKICDTEPCTPFDKNRKGLNLAEGAAFLVLENRKSLLTTGNKALCLLSGWANTADAFHQTATSPDGVGAVLAMNKALAKAKLKPSNIDYINAHGTATINNDLSEATAINEVFGVTPPNFSSTKSFTGHTLAAAGAIEAVFSVLAITNGFLPANLRFKDNEDQFNFQPVIKTKKQVVKHVLSNSFGFGGNCTSLIFSYVH